jgi:N-acyl-L-homoserine lactone synthetase
LIIVVEGHNKDEYAHLLDQMHRHRASVFVERLGWDLPVVAGKERDRYDDENPVYLLEAFDGELLSSLRLMPTTGPTTLADYFSDCIPGGSVDFQSPSIWEVTRLCVALPIGFRLTATYRLFRAVVELARERGIETLLFNFDGGWLARYKNVGVEVLGSTNRYGPPVYLGRFSVNESRGVTKGERA